MGRNFLFQRPVHFTQIAVFHQIPHLYCTLELEICQRYGERTRLLRRIVKRYSTHLPPFLFDIFYQHITFIFVLNDISLQPQRILIQG